MNQLTLTEYFTVVKYSVREKNKNMIFKDIKFNKLKDSKIGYFLGDLKHLGKEIGFNALCMAIAGKGGNFYRVKRQLLGLREKGYFDISEVNNKTFFRLTPKGLELTDWIKFCTGKLKWDKRWRILIFDIPENERHKRDSLRQRLNEIGLKQLQQSVWVTPYPLPDGFSKFVEDLRARPYLYSITAERINRENELKEHFGL